MTHAASAYQPRHRQHDSLAYGMGREYVNQGRMSDALLMKTSIHNPSLRDALDTAIKAKEGV